MDDDRLARRLRDYEDRLPDADPPDARALAGGGGGTPWLLAAAAGTSAVVAAVVVLNTLPSRSPDVGPSPSAASAPAEESPSVAASPLAAAPESAPPSNEPSPVTPSESPGAAGTGWELSSLDYVVDIAEIDGRLVAAGGGPSDLLAWSDDGFVWTPVDLGDDLIPGRAGFQALLGGPAGFVAHGARYGDAPFDPASPFVLVSADGVTWEEVPYPGGCASGATAAAGEFGYVIVGGSDCVYRSPPSREPIAAMLSADGRTWEVVTVPNPFEDSRRRPSHVATDGRTVVAVTDILVRDGDGALWVSDDGGRNWAVRDDALRSGFTPYTIAYGSGRWVAAGSQTDGSGTVACTSSDLVRWECRPVTAALGWLYATATGFVSVTAPDFTTTAVFSSTDGLTWSGGVAHEFAEISPAQSIREYVFPTTHGVFVFGYTRVGEEPDAISEPRVMVQRAPLP